VRVVLVVQTSSTISPERRAQIQMVDVYLKGVIQLWCLPVPPESSCTRGDVRASREAVCVFQKQMKTSSHLGDHVGMSNWCVAVVVCRCYCDAYTKCVCVCVVPPNSPALLLLLFLWVILRSEKQKVNYDTRCTLVGPPSPPGFAFEKWSLVHLSAHDSSDLN